MKITQEVLSQAIEISENMIVMTDTTGIITWCNPAYSRAVGYPPEELVGKNPNIFSSGKHDKAFYKDLWGTILAGHPWAGIMHNKTKAGDPYILEMTITPIRNRTNQVTHFIGIGKNITAQKGLELALIQSDRLSSFGELASGIAHEINNPLAVMSASFEIFRDWLQQSPTLNEKQIEIMKKLIDSGLENLAKAKSIVRDLSSLSQSESLESVPVDVNKILDSSINILWNELKYKTQLTKNYSSNPEVRGHDIQLGQVFMNIILFCARGLIKGNYKTNLLEIKSETLDKHVQIQILVQGYQVPEDSLERIFDPFFTYKKNEPPFGLGLTIAYKIIQDSGGSIRVRNVDSTSTQFTILLPLFNGRADGT